MALDEDMALLARQPLLSLMDRDALRLLAFAAESRILQLHGERMVTRVFAPRARMSVQLKDMRNALETAADMGFSAPVTEALEQLYADAIDHGDADLDHSGLFVELARRNGLT